MRRALLPFIVLILFIAPATAQDTRALSADVLWEMKRIGSPVISPDARWVVAPVTRYDVGIRMKATRISGFSHPTARWSVRLRSTARRRATRRSQS
jgi:hypothetical protein